MALIADCDAAVTAVTNGWITAAGSANVPTTKNAQGVTEPVFANASFTNFIVSTTDLIQTVEGLDNDAQVVITKYTRVSSALLGHTVGTDWGEWTKTS